MKQARKISQDLILNTLAACVNILLQQLAILEIVSLLSNPGHKEYLNWVDRKTK